MLKFLESVLEGVRDLRRTEVRDAIRAYHRLVRNVVGRAPQGGESFDPVEVRRILEAAEKTPTEFRHDVDQALHLRTAEKLAGEVESKRAALKKARVQFAEVVEKRIAKVVELDELDEVARGEVRRAEIGFEQAKQAVSLAARLQRESVSGDIRDQLGQIEKVVKARREVHLSISAEMQAAEREAAGARTNLTNKRAGRIYQTSSPSLTTSETGLPKHPEDRARHNSRRPDQLDPEERARVCGARVSELRGKQAAAKRALKEVETERDEFLKECMI